MTFFAADIIPSGFDNDLNCYTFYNLTHFVLPHNLSSFLPDSDIQNRSELYIKTRLLLRSVLSLYVNVKAPDLTFNYDNAKPRLNDFDNIDFNISHAKDSFAVVVGFNCKCGVDLEYKKVVSYKDRVAERFAMTSDAADLTDDDFIRLWTRTEAVIKCMGQGMFSHAKFYNILRDDVLFKGEAFGLNVRSWDNDTHYISVASSSDRCVQHYSYNFISPGWILNEQ